MISYTLPPGLTETRFPDGGIWYRHGPKYIPGVRKILERNGYPIPPGLDPWYLERGKMVHSATVLIDAGKLNWESLDERILPFCSAYRDFIDVSRWIVEATEIVAIHPSYRYGVRIDREARLPGQDRPLIVDIKCGISKEDSYWLQVAACVIALDEANAADYDLALLNLGKNGHPHFTVADDPGMWVNRWREILEKDVA